VATKRFRDYDEPEFYDEVPEDGTYVYRIRAVRVAGTQLKQVAAQTPTAFEKLMGFLKYGLW